MFVWVNGKKVTVLPSETLRDVRLRAGGNPQSTLRKHGARRGGPGWTMDHALPLRLIGVSPGDKFELVASEHPPSQAKIRAAVDVDGHPRVVVVLNAEASLLDLVRLAQQQLPTHADLLARKGPVLRVLGRVVGAGDGGWAKCLGELGIAGNCVIKMTWEDNVIGDPTRVLDASTPNPGAPLHGTTKSNQLPPAKPGSSTTTIQWEAPAAKPDAPSDPLSPPDIQPAKSHTASCSTEPIQWGKTVPDPPQSLEVPTIDWSNRDPDPSRDAALEASIPPGEQPQLPQPIDWNALRKTEEARVSALNPPPHTRTIDWGSAPPPSVSTTHEREVFKPTVSAQFRDVKVYYPLAHDGVSISSAKDIVLPDDFFDVTEEDVARAQASISRQAQELAGRGNGSALRTKKMRQAEDRQKMARFTKLRIRIEFPDRSLLEATFAPQETITQVYNVLKSHVSPDSPNEYYLFTSPPLTKISSDATETLWALNLVPAALMRIGTSEPGGLVRMSQQTLGLRQHLDDPGACQQNDTSATPNTDGATAKTPGNAVAVAARVSSATNQEKKVPKWFRK